MYIAPAIIISLLLLTSRWKMNKIIQSLVLVVFLFFSVAAFASDYDPYKQPGSIGTYDPYGYGNNQPNYSQPYTPDHSYDPYRQPGSVGTYDPYGYGNNQPNRFDVPGGSGDDCYNNPNACY